MYRPKGFCVHKPPPWPGEAACAYAVLSLGEENSAIGIKASGLGLRKHAWESQDIIEAASRHKPVETDFVPDVVVGQLWPASPPTASGIRHRETTKECKQMFTITVRRPGLPWLPHDG